MIPSSPVQLTQHLGICRRSPDAALDARYQVIYSAATELVQVVLANTHAGRSQAYAVQAIRAALVCADAAVTR